MKKIIVSMMAVAAMCLATSCGNKAQKADAEAVAEEVVVNGGEMADGVIENLKALIAANDAEKLQAALVDAKDKVVELIAQNPEAAKEYVTKVQTYLKENVEQVKAVVGDNAVANAAVSALTEVEPEAVVSKLVDQAKDATVGNAEAVAGAASEKVEDMKDAAKEKVEDMKDAAEQKAQEVNDAAKKKANDAVDNAAKDLKKGLGL